VQLGNPLTTRADAAFVKLVVRRRGGWCYEMNGLLGWALQAIGFDVRRSAGAVMREARGDGAIGNHLVLKVTLPEGVFLADVGFGNGPIDPVPVVAGTFVSHGFSWHLTPVDGDWWRLANTSGAAPDSFDFNLADADEDALRARCDTLQTDPASPFVQSLLVQQHKAIGIATLRGRVLRLVSPDGASERLLHSARELVDVLRHGFALDVPAAAALWPRIVSRHDELFGASAHG
jgi:N-hydroxyarylamine O-acetyltransferase